VLVIGIKLRHWKFMTFDFQKLLEREEYKCVLLTLQASHFLTNFIKYYIEHFSEINMPNIIFLFCSWCNRCHKMWLWQSLCWPTQVWLCRASLYGFNYYSRSRLIQKLKFVSDIPEGLVYTGKAKIQTGITLTLRKLVIKIRFWWVWVFL
jgi:hypothetical protein